LGSNQFLVSRGNVSSIFKRNEFCPAELTENPSAAHCVVYSAMLVVRGAEECVEITVVGDIALHERYIRVLLTELFGRLDIDIAHKHLCSGLGEDLDSSCTNTSRSTCLSSAISTTMECLGLPDITTMLPFSFV
jgi:hypothetical protein